MPEMTLCDNVVFRHRSPVYSVISTRSGKSQVILGLRGLKPIEPDVPVLCRSAGTFGVCGRDRAALHCKGL